MLSRTADSLYWMARYIERAENMARVADVAYRMDLMRPIDQDPAIIWQPALEAAGDPVGFAERHGAVNMENAVAYLSLDRDNPTSIWRCLRAARENARALRGSITTEMWEALNATWLEISTMSREQLFAGGAREFFDRVKLQSHLFRGVTYGTMLHDEAFLFVRLGTFVERADDTARLLDTKYHVLLPDPTTVGAAMDYYQWGALLRSVSAFRAYHRIYRDVITPYRVAELLVLKHDMPRSMHASFDEITTVLEKLAGGQGSDARRLAGAMHAQLHFGRMDDIFKSGLHEFLVEFVRQTGDLGGQIERDFMLRQ
jgi:uncharacterized alpha-E superfamily protein